jgi:carbonic anhydrase
MTISPTAATILQKLTAGNQRFVAGTPSPKDSRARRAQLVDGQQPGAVVVACSDSRVCPEYVFDASLGELFVVRTAGNVVGPLELGSIEYAVEHLHVGVIVVMGHSGCGAVTAACSPVSDKKREAETHQLAAVVREIAPAARRCNNDVVRTIDLNAKLVAQKVPIF